MSTDHRGAKARPLSSDSTLHVLERARNGDTAAARDLMERALPSVRRWARGRLPKNAREAVDTEDVVQDAFLRTLKHLARFRHHTVGALHAYLRRAVINRIHDLVRGSRRRAVEFDADADPQDWQPSPLERAILRERVEHFLAALSRLRPVDRQVVIWRLELGYSPHEIAQRLGKSDAAAAMTMSRALARLSQELQAVAGQSGSAVRS
jgi:RNA polymerase sigma-70 factor (ECF subfamily)